MQSGRNSYLYISLIVACFSGEGGYETLSVSFALVEDCELSEALYVFFCSCAGCVELLPLLEVPAFDLSFGFAHDRC